MKRRLLGPVVAVAVTLSAVAVQAAGIQMPRLFNVPPPRAQVAEAQIWDPYILPDMGFPVDGTRPRDFAPPPEATRGRWLTNPGNPGVFPRQNPELRSWAPVDYPKIGKRLRSSRRTWTVDDTGEPVAALPAKPAQHAE